MSKEVKYTVSDDTNKLINVIAAFDSVGEMLVDVIGENRSDCADVMGGYFDAAESGRSYLFHLLNRSISEKLGVLNNTQI